MFGLREEGRERIRELVERYARNRDHYRAASYNEETARGEFITPFFESLGWDVANRAGNAEAYKDVVHEESVADREIDRLVYETYGLTLEEIESVEAQTGRAVTHGTVGGGSNDPRADVLDGRSGKAARRSAYTVPRVSNKDGTEEQP